MMTAIRNYGYASTENKSISAEFIQFPFTQLLAHDDPEEMQSFDFAVAKGGSPVKVLGVQIPMRSKAEVDKSQKGRDMEYYDMTLAWMVPPRPTYESQFLPKENHPIKVFSQQEGLIRNVAFVNAELTHEYPWLRLALHFNATNKSAPTKIQIGVEFNGTKNTQDDDSKDHKTLLTSNSRGTSEFSEPFFL